MIINENELVKLCKYSYSKLFDYKDICLNDIKISVDEYLHVTANLSYYNVETTLKAIARVRVENDIIIDLDGVIKYGFINFDLMKILKEMMKELSYVTVREDSVVIENEIVKEIKLIDQAICIELK